MWTLDLHNRGPVLLFVTEHTDLSKAKARRVIEAVNVLVTVQTASDRQTAGNRCGCTHRHKPGLVVYKLNNDKIHNFSLILRI